MFDLIHSGYEFIVILFLGTTTHLSTCLYNEPFHSSHQSPIGWSKLAWICKPLSQLPKGIRFAFPFKLINPGAAWNLLFCPFKRLHKALSVSPVTVAARPALQWTHLARVRDWTWACMSAAYFHTAWQRRDSSATLWHPSLFACSHSKWERLLCAPL